MTSGSRGGNTVPGLQTIFHVGLHKTATTFLQRRVFPGLTEVAFVPPPARVRTVLPAAESQGTLLVSDEGISGIPYERDWFGQFRVNMAGLAHMFPEAGIIIGFRAHADLISSIYRQYLHEGGTEDIRAVFDPERSGSLLQPADLSFSARLELLGRLFGDRVFVYTQEEIRDNLPRFIRDLRTFLRVPPGADDDLISTPVNVGVGRQQARILRQLNQLDGGLRRLRFVPTLNNRLFQHLHLDPRGLCQQRLAWLPNRPGREPWLDIGPIQQQWDEDWGCVIAARERRGTPIAGEAFGSR